MGGAVMAYFTDDVDLEPSYDFKMGTVEIEVDSQGGSTSFTVDSGDAWEHEWTVKNTGSLPALLRVTLTDDGLALGDDIEWKVTSDNWDQVGDYWHYKEPVEPEDEVTVEFWAKRTEDGGDGGDLEKSLTMQAEAIQSQYIEDYKDWPETELND